MYENIDRVGIFKQNITKEYKLNHKFSGKTLDINNEIFICEKIEKIDEEWFVYLLNEDGKKAKIKFDIEDDIEYNLDSVKV